MLAAEGWGHFPFLLLRGRLRPTWDRVAQQVPRCSLQEGAEGPHEEARSLLEVRAGGRLPTYREPFSKGIPWGTCLAPSRSVIWPLTQGSAGRGGSARLGPVLDGPVVQVPAPPETRRSPSLASICFGGRRSN